MRYYECHITLESDPHFDVSKIKAAVENLHWKFSAIDGDPSLGVGVKCYATAHFNERMGDVAVLKTLNAVADKLYEQGAQVVRRKIELVIHDTRSNSVKVA